MTSNRAQACTLQFAKKLPPPLQPLTPTFHTVFLSRTDPRHIMMFTEITQIVIEFLHFLLMRLRSFAFEAFFELCIREGISALSQND